MMILLNRTQIEESLAFARKQLYFHRSHDLLLPHIQDAEEQQRRDRESIVLCGILLQKPQHDGGKYILKHFTRLSQKTPLEYMSWLQTQRATRRKSIQQMLATRMKSKQIIREFSELVYTLESVLRVWDEKTSPLIINGMRNMTEGP